METEFALAIFKQKWIWCMIINQRTSRHPGKIKTHKNNLEIEELFLSVVCLWK